MKLTTTKLLTVIIALLLFFSTSIPLTASAASPTYTISPSSKTYKGNMMNFTTYNSNTKHYYLIRSYLERLEKTGGGTLVLKKGTYTISNTLYVPSNVKIVLKDGVTLVKGTKTGTSKFTASKSMFQLIRPSRSGKKGIYGGYKGEKSISFIGEGSATIDMKYVKDGIAIIAGHNKYIKIKNITFKNMLSGHFIEMDATYRATISGNKFLNSKPSANRNKEAINLDTPDKTTKGWNQAWSKYDKTPNKRITIEKNTFKNLDRAIGTHKYSEGKYHESIIVQYNKIDTTRQDAIRVMNWSNSTIQNNTIKNVAGGSGTYRGILASGAINPTFKNNTIENAARPMQFMPWKNSGPGSEYKVTYNKLSNDNIKDLSTNKAVNVTEKFIRINNTYNVFDKDTLKITVQ